MRGAIVTQGYFNNSTATKERFHEDWFCTGDIAVDRGGKFYIVDRKKVGNHSDQERSPEAETRALSTSPFTDSLPGTLQIQRPPNRPRRTRSRPRHAPPNPRSRHRRRSPPWRPRQRGPTCVRSSKSREDQRERDQRFRGVQSGSVQAVEGRCCVCGGVAEECDWENFEEGFEGEGEGGGREG